MKRFIKPFKHKKIWSRNEEGINVMHAGMNLTHIWHLNFALTAVKKAA